MSKRMSFSRKPFRADVLFRDLRLQGIHIGFVSRFLKWQVTCDLDGDLLLCTRDLLDQKPFYSSTMTWICLHWPEAPLSSALGPLLFSPEAARPTLSAVSGSPSWGWSSCASSRARRRRPPSCFHGSSGRPEIVWQTDSFPSRSAPAVYLSTSKWRYRRMATRFFIWRVILTKREYSKWTNLVVFTRKASVHPISLVP